MRQKIVASNWKMNVSRAQVQGLVTGIKEGVGRFPHVRTIILPSFVHLPMVERLLEKTAVGLGGQNLYLGKAGAFTGEISGSMLVDYGCQYVLVGHSERRWVFKEDLELVAAKFQAALDAGLKPILCVGETLAQREKNQTDNMIAEQLGSVVATVGIQAFQQAMIAYEPVWAIGTGLSASPEQAQAVHAFIREQLGREQIDIAKSISILYGGSVKQDNAAGLFKQPDIDGALVGNAGLEVKSFLGICEAAEGVART